MSCWPPSLLTYAFGPYGTSSVKLSSERVQVLTHVGARLKICHAVKYFLQ